MRLWCWVRALCPGGDVAYIAKASARRGKVQRDREVYSRTAGMTATRMLHIPCYTTVEPSSTLSFPQQDFSPPTYTACFVSLAPCRGS